MGHRARGPRRRARRLLACGGAHVRGRLWHASQEVRELPGGRLELRLLVADTLEVRRWLLGFGAEAERLVRAVAPARKPPARAVAARVQAPHRLGAARALRRAR